MLLITETARASDRRNSATGAAFVLPHDLSDGCNVVANLGLGPLTLRNSRQLQHCEKGMQEAEMFYHFRSTEEALTKRKTTKRREDFMKMSRSIVKM